MKEKEPAISINDIDQVKMLQEAFDTFNTATAELQQSYDKLKLQVKDLNLELEETNKKLKKNLKEKEELQQYLQNVLENAPNGVVVINNKGKVKDFNKAAEQITGLELKDIKDKNINEILPQIKKVKEWKKKVFLDKVQHTTKTGEDKFLNVYISSLKDINMRKIGNIIAIEDITNIKRLQEQLQRKNRLEAMGEMAAAISHEIRNPLGAIELFASLLKRDIKGEPDKEELAENIITGVKSLANITSNLLLFTKDMKPKKEDIDINQLIENALIFSAYATSNKDMTLKIDIDKEIKSIHADGELLKQVILNLVLNAIQAIKSKGLVRITARIVNKDDMIAMGMDEDYLLLNIEDSGPGISKENVEKIFNPFFTTKKSGIGLGLAIVHKIISSHGGIIEVSSKEGAGTKFSILLPLN